MGIIDRILGREVEEKRAIGGGWGNDWWRDGTNKYAGVAINQDNALDIAPLFAIIKLYADTVASLPWGAYIRSDGSRRPVTRPLWMDTPIPNNPNFTGFDFRHKMVTSLLLDGNTFILTMRDATGVVRECRVLDPRKVSIKVLADGTPEYHIKSDQGTGVFGTDEIVHITLQGPITEDLRGLSPVEHHRVTLGLASATQLFGAKFFEQGASPSGIIKVPGELTADQAESLRASFGRKHEGVDKMHRVAVLTGGADFTTMSFKPADLALVDTMHWGVESIARIYGVPLQYLQYPGGNTSYNSAESLGQAWLVLGLGPLIARLESALQRLVVGNTTFIKFNLDALLRATTKERYDAYAVALNNGWLSVNEIRQLEDRAPIGSGGDNFRQPLNLGLIGQPPTQGSGQ
jgi:HK97 family phage portal protein